MSFGTDLFTTRAQLRRIDEVLTKRGEAEPARRAAPVSLEPAISLDHVWFRYESDGPWVIRELSFDFARGAIHTIRWPSGTGKSTLLRLIAGLVVPERGTIAIHGLDARRARDLVTYVPQNSPIFSGSVRYNLQLLAGASHERIEAAAAASGLLQLTQSWPMGLETVVSSANISSGQRQLLILTAALASTRPVLLLDEATTHIDASMRAALDASGLLRGRTVLNVLHADAEGSQQ
jgi:ABC-type bacteriocin/lantibiotic exporter with double-glycine peptidase domain